MCHVHWFNYHTHVLKVWSKIIPYKALIKLTTKSVWSGDRGDRWREDSGIGRPGMLWNGDPRGETLPVHSAGRNTAPSVPADSAGRWN